MEEMKMEPIQAVDRAFQALELLSKNGPMTLSDLHREIGVNKASLLRLAFTLVQNGYLSKNTEGAYSLTFKMYEVGMTSIKNLDKFSAINTVLANLSDKTGRIAQFSVEDNNELLCLQSIGQKTATFSVYTNMGQRSPLYSTSAGKALLAAYSNSDILKRWERMDVKPLTEHTITDIHALLADISETRYRQYALDREENEYNVFCVGTALLGADGKPLGAISISGRTLTEEEEKSISTVLLSSVNMLSRMMGFMA